jgi:hypothetical protein
MLTIFMIQYSHKGSAYEGWFNVRAYRTLEQAEKALELEKKTHPDFNYCINAYQLID